MLSYSGYFINIKLCIFYKIFIYNDFKLEIQYLFLKKSLSFILKKYFNIKTLTLVFIKKIYYSLYIIIISLTKTLLCFLTLFYYFFINNFINEFNLIILLLFL